ncbi:MAG: exo-alpha-sialidase, partial [Clostridia bacterium]|nr:exo-alpha-sialidase [Clostridia bacterium]
MFITNKESLKAYEEGNRVWQGIPGIERTQNGRLFMTFYSGYTSETFGNYVPLLKSDDDGDSWEIIACVDESEIVRCFDPVLWIDPLGRLWLTWAKAGDKDAGVYGIICEDPDADMLRWGDVFFIGGEAMMNKPTVLSTGEWIFPCSSWAKNVGVVPRMWNERPWCTPDDKTGAFTIKTSDCGKTFENVGAFIAPNRLYDEHMFVELPDGVLMMINRVKNGMYKAYSYDWGKTWSGAAPFNLPNPSTRMFIRRLKSGRLLCINNSNAEKRVDLTAHLSDDNGMTWSEGLLIDERSEVSYPDAVETADGTIYMIYDRERGSHKKTWEENRACAKEFLMARFTEEDVLARDYISKGSYTKKI